MESAWEIDDPREGEGWRGADLSRFRGFGWISAAELLSEVAEYWEEDIPLPPGGTVVDVGANVGAFTCSAADRGHAGLTVHCFEPAPHLQGRLLENLTRTHSLTRARIIRHPVGLSSARGTLDLCFFRRFPTNSTFHPLTKRAEVARYFEAWADRWQEVAGSRGGRLGRWINRCLRRSLGGPGAWPVVRWIFGARRVRADVTTLSAVIEAYRIEQIDVLKIDVEGHELAVLEGIRPDDWHRIQYIVLETNSLVGTRARVERRLQEMGFQYRCRPQTARANGLDSVIIHAQRSG